MTATIYGMTVKAPKKAKKATQRDLLRQRAEQNGWTVKHATRASHTYVKENTTLRVDFSEAGRLNKTWGEILGVSGSRWILRHEADKFDRTLSYL